MCEAAADWLQVRLRLAQTRLEVRSHRPGGEAVQDTAHSALAMETAATTASIAGIKREIEQAEEEKAELEKTKTKLEEDIR